MVSNDQTEVFRSLLAEGSSRASSPAGRRNASRSRDKGKGKDEAEVFLQEAYRIVRLAILLVFDDREVLSWS